MVTKMLVVMSHAMLWTNIRIRAQEIPLGRERQRDEEAFQKRAPQSGGDTGGLGGALTVLL